MADILEQLQVNQTFFTQLILFAVFFFVLSAIYLKPFQKIIQKRNQKLNDDVAGAAELLKNVEQRLEQYEKSLTALRQEAKVSYDRALSDARAQEDAAAMKHKDELKKEYLKVLEKFQDEKLRVESELKAQAASLSDSIAQKVMAGK